jgi:hypothetical protein
VRKAGSSGTLQGLSATNAPATSATDSGTVWAELLTASRDDLFDLRQGHAELGEDVGRELVGDAEQSEEHVLVLHRPLAGVVDRVRERHFQARHDAKAACARLFERARPNVSSNRSRTLSRSIPSVASASASIRRVGVPVRQGDWAMSPAARSFVVRPGQADNRTRVA